MQTAATVFWLLALFCAGVVVTPAFAEEAAADAAAEVATDGEQKDGAVDEAGLADDDKDETKKLLKKLTIAMISEVVDERTVVIRDASAKSGKKTVHLRLGNIAPPSKGSLNDGEYTEKVNAAKEALTKLVDKQMVWYKAAPEHLQPAGSEDSTPDVMIADLWTIDGKHIPTAMAKDGHLAEEKVYEEELAKDILTVAAEVEKKDSYKKLEEALKESDKAKREAQAAARAEEEKEDEANVEGFGLGGWMGMAVVGILVLGVATNFGRESNKKVNLNRKKGFFEKFWMKLKGA